MSIILTGRDDAGETEATLLTSVPASLELDVSKYSADMDDFDMTDDQKRELLETLWSIMRSFVELGFSVDVYGALVQANQADGEISVAAPSDVKCLIATATETPPEGTSTP